MLSLSIHLPPKTYDSVLVSSGPSLPLPSAPLFCLPSTLPIYRTNLRMEINEQATSQELEQHTGYNMAYRRELLQLLLLNALLLHICSASSIPTPHHQRRAIEVGIGIGIGIGVGGQSPTPSPSSPSSNCPPPAPQPSDFPNLKQYSAYLVIQRFKQSITCDPANITQSWVGYRICDYCGFNCAAPPDSPDTPTIASVDFNGFHLCAPTLAGFLDGLPDLAFFHANNNNFSGSVPDLTGLRFLYELDLSSNAYSGSFPTAVIPTANLIYVDLRFNSFAGAVPPSVFALGLDVLFLNNNGFDWPIPAEIGRSPVSCLTLADNGFTGPIPRSIGNMSKTLIEVLFLNNKLSGCLPYEIGLLNAAKVFDAGFNFITGPIPWSLGCLLRVEQLNLAGNLLYGEVPEMVCRLAKDGNLMNLSLSGNYFTSLGSACWRLVKSGMLDVRQNCIPGLPEQRQPAECARFLLRRPKDCPLSRNIPCSLPKCSVKPAPTAAPPRYMTYEALNQPPRN